MRKTTNYNLSLYDKEDKFIITNAENSLNANMELIDNALKNKADTSEIPTKTSQLINDSDFITSIPSEYVTESELNAKNYLTSVPSTYKTKTENDELYQPKGNYITSFTESDPTVPSHVKAITREDINKWNAGGNIDLSDYATKGEVPTKTSELENDNKFITKEDVEIPVATNTILGGVMPVSKNDSMSQSVGVDASGSLWTAPGASGTLLVAASDAPDTIKNAAQYVCAGVNDQLVINSAIVEVGKGEVRLSGGNYHITGEIKLLDDITLTGRNSIINVCDEISSIITQPYTGGDTIIYVEDASKFVVGQKVSTDSNINSKYDCHIIAIDTEANTVTLDKNLSSSNGFEANKYRLVADFTAVSCYEKENVIVDGIIVNSNGETYTRYDTVLGCNGIELYNSNNCKIINCTVKDTRTHGIAVFGSTACSILNTRVENCYELGIDLSNGQNGEGGHSIVSCTVSGCKGRGIQIHYGMRVNVVACVLSGNVVGLGTQGSGQEVIVTGCNIYDNSADGIFCNVSPGKNIIIADNIISNNSGAIQIEAVEDISITGNTMFHNKNYGVKVLKTSNFVIANNKLYDNCYDDTATEIKTNAAIAMTNACSYGLVTGNNIEINATETKGCACGIAENNMLGDYNVVTNNLIVGARIQATRKLGTNSKFENNYEF